MPFFHSLASTLVDLKLKVELMLKVTIVIIESFLISGAIHTWLLEQ